MRRKAHLALLTAPLFSNNMGCNALTYGSLRVLSEVASKLQVTFEYSLIGNPRDGVVPNDLDGYTIQLVDQLPDFNLRGFMGCALRRDLAKRRSAFRSLKTVDIMLDNAAGDSFSDIYGINRFKSVSRRFKYAIQRGKPLILLPQTIGPFQSNAVQISAERLLRSAHAVYARDPLSVDCANRLAPYLPVCETVDVALFMPYTKRSTNGSGKTQVGINPSGLLWRGGYTGANQFGLKDDYPELIRYLIRHLLSRGDVDIELIGHDINGPNGGNSNDDYYVCKLLQREFTDCRVGPFFYSPVEAKSYISGFDLLIGSRMHCCIAAYSSGVPVFPLGYSRKFKGLFSDKLQYVHMADLVNADRREVCAGLDGLMGEIDVVRMAFPDRMSALDQHRAAFVEHLSGKIAELL
jgi:colanic acid/amylovoran biosynthesis protein